MNAKCCLKAFQNLNAACKNTVDNAITGIWYLRTKANLIINHDYLLELQIFYIKSFFQSFMAAIAFKVQNLRLHEKIM